MGKKGKRGGLNAGKGGYKFVRTDFPSWQSIPIADNMQLGLRKEKMERKGN